MSLTLLLSKDWHSNCYIYVYHAQFYEDHLIVFQCHETRSKDTNRTRARRRMQERLDWHYNGENSIMSKAKKDSTEKKRDSKKASNKRLEKLKLFKEREGLLDE